MAILQNACIKCTASMQNSFLFSVCGFGETYCGDGCQANCNARADCGYWAPVPGTECPVNGCCSEVCCIHRIGGILGLEGVVHLFSNTDVPCICQFGFCGLTDDFCGKGCQSNCAKLSKFQPPSSCPSEPMTKVIGYYSNW